MRRSRGKTRVYKAKLRYSPDAQGDLALLLVPTRRRVRKEIERLRRALARGEELIGMVHLDREKGKARYVFRDAHTRSTYYLLYRFLPGDASEGVPPSLDILRLGLWKKKFKELLDRTVLPK